MWAPGAYLPDRGEGDAVHANIGVEKYFFAAGDRILNRIKDVRGHGDPAGADGPDRGRPLLGGGQQRRRALVQPRRHRVQLRDRRRPASSTRRCRSRRPPGRRASRLANRTGFDVGDTITIDAGTANEEVADVASVAATNPPSPNPNVTLTEALTLAHAVGRGRVAAGRSSRASASSRPTRPRASRRRSSSPPATTGCSSPRSPTRRTRSRPR